MQRTAVPRFDEMLVPAVVALKAKGGSASANRVRDWIAEYLKVTDDLRARPALDGSGGDFDYQLSLACTYLLAYGAIMRDADNNLSLSERGSRVGWDDVPAIRRLVRDDWREAAASRHFEPPAPPAPVVETPMDRLIDLLIAMPADGFEKLCLRILRSKGLRNIEVTGRSADGGFDGFGMRVEKGQSHKVMVQSKRWKTSVGPGVVRDLQRVIKGRAEGGVILTTAIMLPEARKEASRADPKIDVIDRDLLVADLMDLKLGVIVHSKDEIEIDPGFFQ